MKSWQTIENWTVSDNGDKQAIICATGRRSIAIVKNRQEAEFIVALRDLQNLNQQIKAGATELQKTISTQITTLKNSGVDYQQWRWVAAEGNNSEHRIFNGNRLVAKATGRAWYGNCPMAEENKDNFQFIANASKIIQESQTTLHQQQELGLN